MATNLPELHPTRELLEPHTGKVGRALLLVGAFGIATGLGYAARTLVSPRSPAPSPNGMQPALVVQKNDDSARDTTTAPAAKPGSPEDTDELGDDLGGDEVEEATVAIGQKPEEAPAAAAVPSDGAFYVQVAAYKNDKDAADYAETLKARSLPVNAEAASNASAGSWHLVRLGPFKNRVDAEKARFQLKPQEREKAYVEPRSNGKYHVQVASFATMEEAEPLAKRLAARGHVTKISRIKMGDKRWYCVRIGPFDTAEEATGYQELVKDVPGTQPTVIPFGPPKQ